MMSSEAGGADSNDLSAAYVLHTRKYRDTSLIAELYTQAQGRVAVVAKGARSKRGVKQAIWQPFTPLLISYIGKGDLKTVTGIEFSSSGFRLTGENLIMGLYVNELMVRLLAKSDPLENLFGAYQSVLKDLMIGEAAQASLRKFELFLLDAMGYDINFNETSNRAQIEPNKRYEFRAGEGFIPVVDVWRDHQSGETSKPGEQHDVGSFRGETLRAISERDFTEPEALRCAKVILRTTFHYLLGGKPLKSRELFVR